MNVQKVEFYGLSVLLGSRCELFKGGEARCLLEAVPILEWLVKGLTLGSGLVLASVEYLDKGEVKTLKLSFGPSGVGGDRRNQLLDELTEVLSRVTGQYGKLEEAYRHAYFPQSYS